MQARLPVGRFGRPDEIASIVEMLVLNSYMTNKVRNLRLSRSKLERYLLRPCQIIVADGGAAPSAF